ncbi:MULTISPECIES: DUF58 domain-containing protein [Bacillus]|uniref:DUF58 domain-containing protein n=1 Tax=Bacillus TaxID=1386 RepID=UPI00041E11F9|nr:MULTISPECIES: DUF58 domain-containing protein [Bacillus]QHZ48403.1 DUF58 domain-containing protein [Bacillus sp. NSP9.1]
MRERIGLLKYGWKLFVLFLLSLAAFSYAMFQGGFVSWFLFFAFLPFMLYAFLFAIYPLSSITAVRKISGEHLRAGERLNPVITLKRKVPFPLMFMIVEDCLSDSLLKNGNPAGAKQFLFPWFKKEIKMAYTIDSVPRGDHRLKEIRIRTGDPLGLVEKEISLQVETSFFVLPSYQDIAFHARSGKFDDQSGYASDLRRKNSTLASGVREYQPGDRFAWVDWKASARRNQLMTKEFEQTKGHDLLIFLDQSPSDAFEDIVSLTASIVRAALRDGTNTGLVAGGKEKARFPARNGEEHLQHLFHYLAVADCDALYPFHTLMDSELNSPDVRNAVTYVVTSRITVELSNVLAHTLKDNPPVVFLVKDKGGDVSREENAAVEHLRARGTEVSVIYGGRFSRAFAKAR